MNKDIDIDIGNVEVMTMGVHVYIRKYRASEPHPAEVMLEFDEFKDLVKICNFLQYEGFLK